jgi:hypothetical protein
MPGAGNRPAGESDTTQVGHRFPLARLILACLVLLGAAPAGAPPDIALFAQAASVEEGPAREAMRQIAAAWRDDYAAPIVDLARLMRAPLRTRASADLDAPAPSSGDDVFADTPAAPREPFPAAPRPAADPSARVRERLVRFLEKQTGQRFGHDLSRWRQWIWNRPYAPHPDYAAFKAAVYGRIDPRMGAFFAPGAAALIRLDEVDWGGVRVNGIPPLVRPRHVPASEARYLGEKDVVFGIALQGEARAYPKRILAWHELARDRVGGVELTIVYCTLCGTVIPYGSEAGGALRSFGTSGLLYRSNKLMFDEETMSLWSSVEGRPVIGPLAGSGLELRDYPVVTTTWREWRATHPLTTVLSLDTGFERDYAEGAAYRDYFASDRLMFTVPRIDTRLRNKDEVLALLVTPPGGGERRPIAFAADFLRKQRLVRFRFAGRELLVVTTPDGANRVYEAGPRRFTRLLEDGRLQDEEGRRWAMDEDALRAEEGDSPALPRLPARRAFWFGWYAQFPDTELVTARR